jgi:hypothetical protein
MRRLHNVEGDRHRDGESGGDRFLLAEHHQPLVHALGIRGKSADPRDLVEEALLLG